MTTLSVTVQLTQANILNMYSTPIMVLGAPGAGLTYIIDTFTINYNFNTAPYSGGGNITLQFGNTPHAGAGVITNGIINNVINAQSNAFGYAVGSGVCVARNQSYVNTPVYISNSSGFFGVGNGSATLVIYYQIVTAV